LVLLLLNQPIAAEVCRSITRTAPTFLSYTLRAKLLMFWQRSS
jgi:hypothetical protein